MIFKNELSKCILHTISDLKSLRMKINTIVEPKYILLLSEFKIAFKIKNNRDDEMRDA